MELNSKEYAEYMLSIRRRETYSILPIVARKKWQEGTPPLLLLNSIVINYLKYVICSLWKEGGYDEASHHCTSAYLYVV